MQRKIEILVDVAPGGGVTVENIKPLDGKPLRADCKKVMNKHLTPILGQMQTGTLKETAEMHAQATAKSEVKAGT